ncbi:MAG: YlxM family DNA-binding protein [Clostridiales bacterium]|jgi:predicted DNA-binding protein YlxM (UPF0122 family)|nr:YlxM family DNA-binding protein [Clostridiales bacterium]
MSKDLNITLLFDFYRNMLTDKQADVIDLYYNEDLSLAEIAEHLCITRQGVRDNIKRAEMILKDAEENLGIAKRYITIKTAAQQISKEIEEMEKTENASAAPWVAPRLERIKKLLEVIRE